MVAILNVLEKKNTPSGVQRVSSKMQTGLYQAQSLDYWRMQPVPMPRSKQNIYKSPSRLMPAVFCFSKLAHLSNPWMPMFCRFRKEVMPLTIKMTKMFDLTHKPFIKNSTI
jgi:hypothetical protein